MSKRATLGLLLLLPLFLAGCFFLLPTFPEVLYEEDFDGSPLWYQGEDDSRTWWVEQSKYHLLIKVRDITFVSRNTQIGPLTDFQLDMDTYQLSGPDNNGYGVTFRHVDTDNLYRFSLSGDGWVRFDKKVNGSYNVIRPWERTDLIHQGNATNHITVVADGSEFTFYINGQEVYDAAVLDTQFSSGNAGVFGVMLESPGQTHIAFDNLVIQALE
ncbi:LamG domain-containing protein [Candidatus Bipolaricaulota bacterium]|nr:LamG domain-containing protein [Candidatus Bipolaricaulota bacterium]